VAGSKKGGKGKAVGERPKIAPPVPEPWKLRFSARILSEDLGELGHAAYENARKAIQKKLPIDPHQYGDGLRPPLGGIHKLKSSHVRVAYHIEESEHEVWILMIADRNVIWDRHEEEILGRLGGMLESQRHRRAAGSGSDHGPTKGR
jgi:mRNA-degrading endonuclease RelE of RelBE toxin-antitoxin system